MIKNFEVNAKFLSVISSEAKDIILSSIAKHYGVSNNDIYEELIDQDAENVLDYRLSQIVPLRHFLCKYTVYDRLQS